MISAVGVGDGGGVRVAVGMSVGNTKVAVGVGGVEEGMGVGTAARGKHDPSMMAGMMASRKNRPMRAIVCGIGFV
jgi:hypothetical protein